MGNFLDTGCSISWQRLLRRNPFIVENFTHQLYTFFSSASKPVNR
jgi:hypothetical protein